MKIVYVYPKFTALAGTERVLIDKMNYLSTQKDIDVYVVTHDQGSHSFAFPLASSINHIDLNICFYQLYKYNYFKRFFKWLKYRRLLHNNFVHLIASIDPDIVVAMTYYPNIMSLINACPGHFIKILESHIDKRYLHSNDPIIKNDYIKKSLSKCKMEYLTHEACKFDLLVSLHQKDAEEWSRYLKTRVIINIVHLNDTGQYSNRESKHIIFVGRYTVQKGIPDLFRIWKIVFQKHPDWHLDLYGDGDNREIPYTEEYWNNNNIHVHPSDSNIFLRYIESSIFVLTSLYEPFGLVIPEAMSCGLPVIAFDCPSGPAQIIDDGVDGFLIKNRNVDEFADKVSLLIETPTLRYKMGESAILSSQKYSAEQIMPQWLNLFYELMNNPKR